MKKPLIIKIMMGGEYDCPMCGVPEEECECDENEQEDEED